MGREAGADLGEVEQECDQDQNTLYERTHKNEEEKIRTEQAMDTREKPLIPGHCSTRGNTGSSLPPTHKGIPSLSLFIKMEQNNGSGSLAKRLSQVRQAFIQTLHQSRAFCWVPRGSVDPQVWVEMAAGSCRVH